MSTADPAFVSNPTGASPSCITPWSCPPPSSVKVLNCHVQAPSQCLCLNPIPMRKKRPYDISIILWVPRISMIPVNSANIYLTDLKFSFSDNTLFTEDVILEMGSGEFWIECLEGARRTREEDMSLRDKEPSGLVPMSLVPPRPRVGAGRSEDCRWTEFMVEGRGGQNAHVHQVSLPVWWRVQLSSSGW